MQIAESEQKAIKMLHKLLSAARRAEAEGKPETLKKVIDQASRISVLLNRSMERTFDEVNSYIRVQGEIVE